MDELTHSHTPVEYIHVDVGIMVIRGNGKVQKLLIQLILEP
jgi:hypothetical protein